MCAGLLLTTSTELAISMSFEIYEISCMGGFCDKRETCQHYVTPTRNAEENLCNQTMRDEYKPATFQQKEQK